MDESVRIEYLKHLVGQVQHQLDIRDRWFRYYLTIAAAVFGLSVTTVNWLIDAVTLTFLILLLLVLLILMTIIGWTFLLIFLSQRRNLLGLYRLMAVVEDALREPLSKDDVIWIDGNAIDNVPEHPVSRLKPYGADYYTSWIHVLINGAYLGGVFALAFLYFSFGSAEQAVAIGMVGWLFGVVLGDRVRRRHFVLPSN